MPGCTSPIPRPDSLEFSGLQMTSVVYGIYDKICIIVSTLWRYSLVSQYLRFGNQYVYTIIYIYTHLHSLYIYIYIYYTYCYVYHDLI